MKTKHTGKLFAFLLALVMMFGIMPMTAFAAGGSESDPVIVSTFADLKAAMENTGVTYVQLEAGEYFIPFTDVYSDAIRVIDTKVLILNGDSTVIVPFGSSTDSIMRLDGAANLTIKGSGVLKAIPHKALQNRPKSGIIKI